MMNRISKQKRPDHSHITKLERKNKKRCWKRLALMIFNIEEKSISGNHDAKQTMRLEKENIE